MSSTYPGDGVLELSKAAPAHPLRAWSLLTKTRKGVVSILRDLTLDECRQAYQHLNPQYGFTYRYEENPKALGSFGCGSKWREFEDGSGGSDGPDLYDENTIDLRAVFGPPDRDQSEVKNWDEWPKFVHILLGDPDHPATKTRPDVYDPQTNQWMSYTAWEEARAVGGAKMKENYDVRS